MVSSRSHVSGSLWTSIIPCLALRGVGTAVATSPSLLFKVLILNASHDRETAGMNALDFVFAICRALNTTDKGANEGGEPTSYPIHELVTHVVYVPQGKVAIPIKELEVRSSL